MVNVSLLKATALAFLEDLISTERSRAMAAEAAIIANTIGIPVGGILIFPGTLLPDDFLFARGQAVSRTVYPALFGVCGITYGPGDGSTTFNVPDMTGRVAVGVGSGSGLTTRALGDRGGAETHQLTVDQLPAHTHPVNLQTSGGGEHSHPMGTFTTRIQAGTWWDAPVYGGEQHTGVGGWHAHNVNGNTDSRGGGQAHNNMQPFLGLNYIIRAR